MEAFTVIIGWILVGFGALLLLLNGMAARHDSPEAQRTTGIIALLLMLAGFAVLIFSGAWK